MPLRTITPLALGLALAASSFPFVTRTLAQENKAAATDVKSDAEEKPAKPEPKTKAKPSKKKDDENVSIEIKFDGKEETFENPAKATPLFKKVLTQSKLPKRGKDKDKEKEGVDFEATITIEKNRRKFTDPALAQEAAQALIEATKDLKRVNASFADLGDIPDAPSAGLGGPVKWDQKKIAEGQAEVTRRIAAARQAAGAMGNAQQIAQQEIEKARQEGIIPAQGEGQAPARPMLTGNEEARRKTMLEWVKGRLQETYGKGTSVADETEKPAESN